MDHKEPATAAAVQCCNGLQCITTVLCAKDQIKPSAKHASVPKTALPRAMQPLPNYINNNRQQ